jgi:hypothetical protein
MIDNHNNYNMKTKFFLFLLIFALSCGYVAIAENIEEESGSSAISTSAAKKPSFLSKLNIGGNISSGIQNDYYFVTLAPRVSMNVTKWFAPGVTVVYMYSQQKGAQRVITNTYGAGVFTDFYPIKYVFARAEYQHLWYNQKIKGIDPRSETFSDHFLLLGGGVKVPIGAKMSAYASVSFNVLNNERSEHYMYTNPIYSVGIDVNL